MAHAYRKSDFDTSADTKRERALGAEESHSVGHGTPEYDDPFGNEEFADVRYRTLYWW